MLRIRCLVPFQDLTIIPRKIKQNEEIDVSDRDFERIKASGGKFQLLGHVIPPLTTEAVTDAEPPKVVSITDPKVETDVYAIKGLKKVKKNG